MGAFFPEFEFNAHRFKKSDLKKILSFDIPCFAISGNNHAARPFLDLKLPFGIWPGSTFWEDCKHHVFQAPLSFRKILDLATKSSCERLEYRIFNKAAQIVVDTTYTRDRTLAFNSLWSNKITVIPVPVDTAKYTPILNPTQKYFLLIGRLSDPRKNIDLLLNAFSLYARKNTLLNLVLIGSGDQTTRRKLCEHPFSERIQWLEGISESEKIERIQNATALIIPSFQEGFGIVGAEALACGIPVISTPCGGTEDYVIHEQTGLLLNGFDPPEMAEAMLRISTDSILRKHLSEQGREFAVSHLSIDAVRPKIQRFIHQR